MDPAYRIAQPSLRFQFNDTTLLALRKIKDSQNNYIWDEGNARLDVPPSILGYRYSINQEMDDFKAGSKKPMIFGDHQKFWTREGEGTEVCNPQGAVCTDQGDWHLCIHAD